MHNRLMLVDDTVFITSGRNIANEYYNQSGALNFRDRDVLVVGPVATYAAASFDEYWTYKHVVPSVQLKDVAEAIRTGELTRLETREDFALHGFFDTLEQQAMNPEWVARTFVTPLQPAARAMFLADPPGKESRAYTAWRRGTIAKQLEDAMRTSRTSLLLQTPYLVLDGGMLKMFRDMRKANPALKIQISSNSYGSTDNTLVYAANFKLRPSYIRDADLFVYEYMPKPAILSALIPNYSNLLHRAAPREMRTARDGGPFVCIHAKSFVVEDAALAAELQWQILRDMGPSNSWVISERKVPLPVARVTRAMETPPDRGVMDLWSARYTTSFALTQGAVPVLPKHPNFYERYRDAGVFPGADEGLTFKEILANLMGVLSDLTIPLL